MSTLLNLVELFGERVGLLIDVFGDLNHAIDERKSELERLSEQLSAVSDKHFTATADALSRYLFGAGVACVVFDGQGRCFLFNKEAVDLLGPEFLTDANSIFASAPEDLPWSKALRTDAIVQEGVQLARQDRTLRFSCVPCSDKSNSRVVLALIIDVSEQEAVEKALFSLSQKIRENLGVIDGSRDRLSELSSKLESICTARGVSTTDPASPARVVERLPVATPSVVPQQQPAEVEEQPVPKALEPTVQDDLSAPPFADEPEEMETNHQHEEVPYQAEPVSNIEATHQAETEIPYAPMPQTMTAAVVPQREPEVVASAATATVTAQAPATEIHSGAPTNGAAEAQIIAPAPQLVQEAAPPSEAAATLAKIANAVHKQIVLPAPQVEAAPNTVAQSVAPPAVQPETAQPEAQQSGTNHNQAPTPPVEPQSAQTTGPSDSDAAALRQADMLLKELSAAFDTMDDEFEEHQPEAPPAPAPQAAAPAPQAPAPAPEPVAEAASPVDDDDEFSIFKEEDYSQQPAAEAAAVSVPAQPPSQVSSTLQKTLKQFSSFGDDNDDFDTSSADFSQAAAAQAEPAVYVAPQEPELHSITVYPQDAGSTAEMASTNGAHMPTPIAGIALIADDTKENRIALQTQLKRLGVDSDVVSNGREALDAVTSYRYAVVLMDLDMPVMNGLEATAAIRAKERAGETPLPIIALTSYDRDSDRKICQAAGMTDCLVRSASEGDFFKVLGRYVEMTAPEPEPVAAVAATSSTSSATNVAQLSATSASYSAQELPSILEQFVKSVNTFIECLKVGIEQRNADAVGQFCHSISGMCSALTFNEMADAAKRLSTDAEAQNWTKVSSDYQELTGMFHTVKRELSGMVPVAKEG